MSHSPEPSPQPPTPSQSPQDGSGGHAFTAAGSSSTDSSTTAEKDAQKILSDAGHTKHSARRLVPSTKIFVLVLSLMVLTVITLGAMRDTISTALTVHRIENSSSFVIRGTSMEPTYHDGQVVRFFNQSTSHSIHPGDIAVFVPPSQWRAHTGRFFDTSPYIKRVVASHGDTVSLKNGVVFVNDIKTSITIPQSYGCDIEKYRSSSYTVPLNETFVVGDNVEHSQDSLYAMCHNLEPVFVPNEKIKRHGTLYIDEKFDETS